MESILFQILMGVIAVLVMYILRDVQARIVRLEDMFMVLVARNGDKELLSIFRKVKH